MAGNLGVMRQNRIWDFYERINFSEGIDCSDNILKWIFNCIPNATRLIKSNINDDKQGTDFWIYRNNLRPLSIDLKNRDFCPIQEFGSDDACIETTSVYKGANNYNWLDENRKVIGWTLDTNKQTDYIVYTWPNENGNRRFWIVPFHFLCMASRKNWKEWAKKYGEKSAINKNYLTLAVYPPRRVITESMARLMVGNC